MKSLHSYIANKTPKFNKSVVEGLVYTRMENALDYIDNFIRYTCTQRKADGNNNIIYLGHEEVSPEIETKINLCSKPRTTYDIAENNMYLVKFMFKYANYPDILEYLIYLPYIEKGNTIKLSGSKFLVMPTLADKVVSIGEKIIFINILTAKYSFNRRYHSVVSNGQYIRSPIILTELYKNQSKRTEDTTKSKILVMHYLLSEYGYSKTMMSLLGYVPTPTYNCDESKHRVVKTTGNIPHGYIQDHSSYVPTKIKFIIPEGKADGQDTHCLGNVIYILDQFPDRMTIDKLDDPLAWRRLLSEIIHSGNHGLSYLNEKISAHFNDLNSNFDTITINKLKDIGIESNNLLNLLEKIFINFNSWVLKDDVDSYFYNKSYEVESFVLSYITSMFTRVVLDINKEELRTMGGILDIFKVKKIFDDHIKRRSIFKLKDEKRFVTSVEYAGDHLYFKNTKMVGVQESDFVSKESGTNTSDRKKITAESSVIGSILALSKKNPTPIIHVNPYVNIDPDTGTVLPHKEYMDIINRTNDLLNNLKDSDDVKDISDDDIVECDEDMSEDDLEETEEDQDYIENDD